MGTLSCLCSDDLVGFGIDNCDDTKYGNQIVKLFIQKMDGSPFTGATLSGTEFGIITEEADWDAKIGATGDDTIIIIDDIIGIRPSAEATIEEGNDVRFGGVEVIDRPQTITFSMKNFNQAIFKSIDTVACWDKVRFWFLDNRDYLWAGETATDGGNGVEDANVIMTTMGQAGIGTRNKMENCQIRWNNLLQPVEGAQLSFLKAK